MTRIPLGGTAVTKAGCIQAITDTRHRWPPSVMFDFGCYSCVTLSSAGPLAVPFPYQSQMVTRSQSNLVSTWSLLLHPVITFADVIPFTQAQHPDVRKDHVISVPVEAKMGITELDGRITQSNVDIPNLAFPLRPYPGLVSAIV